MLIKCHQGWTLTFNEMYYIKVLLNYLNEWHPNSTSALIRVYHLSTLVYSFIQSFSKHLLQVYCITEVAVLSFLISSFYKVFKNLKIGNCFSLTEYNLTRVFCCWLIQKIFILNLKRILRCGIFLIHMSFWAFWILFTVSLIFHVGSPIQCRYCLRKNKRPKAFDIF